MSASPFREPGEETLDLYPGLVVCDGRVTGSITVGRTRLPLWAIGLTFDGWDEDGYPSLDGMRQEDAERFVFNLLNQRGEIARLLLILADEERRERAHRPWWYVKRARRRVRAQLKRCLAVLEEES